MKKIVVKSYDELSQLTASIILSHVTQDKRSNISITAGESPKGTYKILVDWAKKYPEMWSNSYFFNFDEIENKNHTKHVTMDSLKEQFFNPAGITPEKIFHLNYDNYAEYDTIIEKAGGLDLMLIGLGGDGHFCGNMPIATNFDQYTYKIPISPEFPWYDSFGGIMPKEELTSHFVTMGFKSLLRVKHLVLIVNGKAKAKAVRELFTREITTNFPSSTLRQHPNLTIILDEDAASELSNE